MWTELLENPKAVEMFTTEPSLERVSLSRLVLDRDGPTVTMTIELQDYPENPPAKWRMQQHNAVTMDLQAMAVDHLVARGWTVENVVSVTIERMANEKLQIRASSQSVEFQLQCGWLRVTAVTPYRRAA